ncbi:MAG TPA: TA system VapC family ribonuclease toxin [Chloroflexota bacterium]|nr:TA system VapC family ribonuclease toxin [Chloroflexota bacterium]
MSVTVDANVLVYASNTADPAFPPTRALLERLAGGPDLVYLFWPTIMGYLRIVTHPGILPRPLTFRDATTNISMLLSRPHIRTHGENGGFWDLFLATSGQTRGNAVPDAHLVTLMRQFGVTTIYTRDRDFRRYAGITVRDPLA